MRLSRRRFRTFLRWLKYWSAISIMLYVAVNTFLDPLDLSPSQIRDARNLLWLIAHPDDESLFFSPSLINLLRNERANGYVISLSSGNSEGLGSIRTSELTESCNVYGIESKRCVVISNPKLQDSMDIKDWWDANVIINILDSYIRKWDIDLIITFDNDGISYHPNHKATSESVTQYMIQKQSTPQKIPNIYILQSTNIIFKYTHILSFPISLLRYIFTCRFSTTLPILSSSFSSSAASSALLSSSFSDYLKAVEAFHKHGSQSRWFRHIFYTISRYMWFNELAPVAISN